MTSADMDQVTVEPQDAPAPIIAAPTPRPLRNPSAWLPRLQMGERRWWTAALAATLLITAFGLGVLYVDDSNNQAAVRSLTTQNESLTGRNQILMDQLKSTQTNLTATLGELAQTKA